MKKIILAIAITACFASQVNAQFKFGLKGGVNFENIKIKDARSNIKVDNSTGWQAGAAFKVKIPGIGVAVQPELLYTVSKVNLDQEQNGIHYFEVPINLQMGLDLKIIRPYLQAGPYFGYALKSEGDTFKDNINKFDWGIGLGGGLDLWKLQFDLRYSWGLQDVSSVTDFEIKNNRLSLSLAYFF